MENAKLSLIIDWWAFTMKCVKLISEELLRQTWTQNSRALSLCQFYKQVWIEEKVVVWLFHHWFLVVFIIWLGYCGSETFILINLWSLIAFIFWILSYPAKPPTHPGICVECRAVFFFNSTKRAELFTQKREYSKNGLSSAITSLIALFHCQTMSVLCEELV